jgi:hypothetical protein
VGLRFLGSIIYLCSPKEGMIVYKILCYGNDEAFHEILPKRWGWDKERRNVKGAQRKRQDNGIMHA